MCPGSTHLWSNLVQPDEWTTTKLTAARVTTVVVFPTVGIPLAMCGGALAIVLFIPAVGVARAVDWCKRKAHERERRRRIEVNERDARTLATLPGSEEEAEAYRRLHGVPPPVIGADAAADGGRAVAADAVLEPDSTVRTNTMSQMEAAEVIQARWRSVTGEQPGSTLDVDTGVALGRLPTPMLRRAMVAQTRAARRSATQQLVEELQAEELQV